MSNKFTNPYFLIFIIWVLLVVFTLITSHRFIAVITVFFTGVLPFVFAIVWFGKSEVGKKILNQLQQIHTAIILSWFVFIYLIYAQRWSASVINEIFHISADNFDITYMLLVALFAPFGIFYQESWLNGLQTTIVIVAMVFLTMLFIKTIFSIKVEGIGKIIASTLAIIFLASFFVTTTTKLLTHKNLLIREFAVWADFNAKHLCTDEWVKDAHSVLFLGGNKVLVYTPSNAEGSRFASKICNYKNTF